MMKRIESVSAPSRQVIASLDGIQKTILRRWPITDHIEGRQESWFMASTEMPPVTMDCAYANDGSYIGDLAWGKYLAGKMIRPERRSPDSNVCSIGYSPVLKKWFGWSHRAIIGFAIGDRIFETDYGDDHTSYTEHGSQPILNMDHARQAAEEFADYVG